MPLGSLTLKSYQISIVLFSRVSKFREDYDNFNKTFAQLKSREEQVTGESALDQMNFLGDGDVRCTY